SSAAPSSPASTAAPHDSVEKDFSLVDQGTMRRSDAAKTEAPGSGEPASNRALPRDISSAPGGAAQSLSSQQAMPQKKLTGATPSSYRERRKEQVALPAQATVSQVQEALDSVNALPLDVGHTAERRMSPPAPNLVAETREQKPHAVKILTFEGE